MRWEMEMEEVEAVLERIWDLHDRISDAIHAISRAHFLKSVKSLGGRRPCDAEKRREGKAGFVYVKKFKGLGDDEEEEEEEEEEGGESDVKGGMAEARSLNAIRTALENLEDQLEFFHTVQSQQRAERDAAIARLEQSRIILARRLADHHGKKYKVIEEARAFVGEVHDTGRFVAPEMLYEMSRTHSGANLDDQEGTMGVLMKMLLSSLAVAKKSLRLERFGGILGNAALFAVSMLALLQLHQVAFKSDTAYIQDQTCCRRRNEKTLLPEISSKSSRRKQFNVLSARG